ncbi:MAG: TonB-dependent receptor plug domain-containing protein [Ignavibacteriales bacterium]|nr:TonB-dependent receptor plug domain-containing protein [Ignavibacteriales bacterium]
MRQYFVVYIALVGLLILPATALSQSRGTLKGRALDAETGEPLMGANALLQGANRGAASDADGEFVIPADAGADVLAISYVGYKTLYDTIDVAPGETLERDYRLESEYFEIGGVTVTADAEFMPLDPETKTTISAGEIEHMQASSLGDVLELTPGVETSNPTLNSAEQASIRGGDAVGAQITLDGAPVSNNANLQVGVGYSTANSGVDLRALPAENVERVEVIRGVPGAEYGDLVDGLLIVKTSSAPQSPRLKMKYNPNVYESNLAAGERFGEWVLNGSVNLANSQRDVRIEGDGYTRLAARLSAERRYDDFKTRSVFYYTRAFDNREEQPGYALREAWYNEDVNLKYTGNFDYAFDDFSQFEGVLSASYTAQDSYEQQLVSRDNMVISDRREEGAQEGRIVFGSYLGKKWIKGDVWNLYADAKYSSGFFTGDLLHKWIVGATWRDDFNKGDGVVFDPLFPPSLSIPSPRVRTYEEIPHYQILSFYAEDKVTGRIVFPFTLQVGVRYEAFRPEGMDVAGLWGGGDLIESANGSFLNPRLNFSFNPIPTAQIRLGYGATAKSPPMGMIFAQDKYYDIVDTVSVVDPLQPDSNFSIVSTYVRPQANPDLQAYRQQKYEASIDWQIGDDAGLTATGFYADTRDGFTTFSVPTTFYKRSFPDWPQTESAYAKDTLLDSYSRYANKGWRTTKGVEVGFKTRRLPPIDAVFKFDASYRETRSGAEDDYSLGTKRFVEALGFEAIPIYSDVEYFSKELLINYRLEVQSESLGMWATIHVQQALVDYDDRIGYDDTLAIGYYSRQGEEVRFADAERADPRYSQLRRYVEPWQLNAEDRPNKWLVNLKVTKGLWTGAAISFFVNNIFNDRPLYESARSAPTTPTYSRRNPSIFYGLEFHASLKGLWNRQ